MAIIKLLNKYLPSFKLNDPLANSLKGERCRPLSIRELQLTPFMGRQILKIRSFKALELQEKARLTVVIPYRDRQQQLEINVPRLKQFLDSKQINNQIVVVEQAPGKKFNRGKLLNIGAALTEEHSDYYCFHDIDMMPIKANYQFGSQPLRLITKLVTTHRNLETFLGIYFSGVITVNKAQFQQANGFSNNYWGWGKEDDDFLFRLLLQGYVPYVDFDGEYEEEANPEAQVTAARTEIKKGSNRDMRSLILRGQSDPKLEGLNSLNYEILSEETNDIYRKVTVEI